MKQYITAFVLLFSPLFARDQIANYSEECATRLNTRVGIKHREHSGLGYGEGYSTFSLFLCPNTRHSMLPFIDLRGHRFTDGRYAGNAGFGFRIADDRDKYIFGANFYYDFRNASWISPEQLGVGFELLGPRVDFRANGYYPFGKTKATRSTEKFAGFAGNGILFERLFRLALPLVECEFGFPFETPFLPLQMYFAIGPYYLFRETAAGTSCGNNIGGKARLNVRLFDGVLIGLETTYDEVFHGHFQGFLSLSVPLGPANMIKGGRRWRESYKVPHCDEYARLMARQAQDVQRNEIIPICRGSGSFNPGFAQNIIFVNNESFETGSGTFENPYSSLSQAEANSLPGDVIYVIAGVGDFAYEEGITLQMAQRLQGSGKGFTLEGVEIGALTPGSDPIISNPFGSGVVMADSSTVFGFNLISNGLDGVQADTVSDITVACNTMRGNNMSGVSALTLGGSSTISQNIIENNLASGLDIGLIGGGSIALSENTVQNNVFSGASLQAEAGSSTFAITDNIFRANKQFGIEYQEVGAAVGSVSITESTFTNHTTSEIMLTGLSSTFTISENSFAKTEEATSQFIIGASMNSSITISNNTLSTNLVMLAAPVELSDDSGGSAVYTVEDNTITASSIGISNSSIVVNINNATMGSVAINRNTITNGTIGNTIGILMTDAGADWTSTIDDNTISTGINGILQSIEGRMVSSANRNLIASQLNFGMDFSTTAGGATFCLDLENNNAPFYSFAPAGGSTFRLATDSGDVANSNNFSSLGPAGFSVGGGVTQVTIPAGPCP